MFLHGRVVVYVCVLLRGTSGEYDPLLLELGCNQCRAGEPHLVYEAMTTHLPWGGCFMIKWGTVFKVISVGIFHMAGVARVRVCVCACVFLCVRVCLCAGVG